VAQQGAACLRELVDFQEKGDADVAHELCKDSGVSTIKASFYCMQEAHAPQTFFMYLMFIQIMFINKLLIAN